MATISKSWAAEVQIEGAADGYTTLSGVTEEYSASVDLETDGYEGATLEIGIDFDVTPTDNVEIRVYASKDGSYVATDLPFIGPIEIDNGVDILSLHLIVRDLPHFRVGIKQTGSTDSHNVRAYHRRWRWQSV